MKHYFYATFAVYEEGEQSFQGTVIATDEYKVSGLRVSALLGSRPEAGLELVSISYLGHMTEEEFGPMYEM